MNIKLTQKAVEWFKNELDLPISNKVLQFYVKYGGEFQLKQGFSPAFTVENKDAIEMQSIMKMRSSTNEINIIIHIKKEAINHFASFYK
ncbi:MAG: hypothetical protein E6889_01775 [Staphylococcus epidermidis]|nr:hypothetical protein [Staphylococcus epidermidis]